jgi:NADPH:quinone reductase-like Zn-dependent oxidoreductase
MHARAIEWPRPGVVRMVDIPLREPGADEVLVDIAVTVTSTGTELARFRSLPNAVVDYPHRPGFMGAGIVAMSGTPQVEVGDAVAIRLVGHQSRAVVNRVNVRTIPPRVELVDGALWHLGLIALYGLRRGDYEPEAPLAIVGAGIVGAVARRLALAAGTPDCLVVATSDAKRWASAEETATRFMALSGALLDDERALYPLTIDATGAAEGLRTSAALTAVDGTVVLLGSPRAELSPLPVRAMQARGVSVVGAHIGTMNKFATEQGTPVEAELTETFFRLLADGVSFADLIERHSPREAPEVYAVASQEPSVVAAAFDWSGEA